MHQQKQQELVQLLQETEKDLVVVTPTIYEGSFKQSQLSIEGCKVYLQKRWTTYGVDTSGVMSFLDPHIRNKHVGLELQQFIKSELSVFLDPDCFSLTMFLIEHSNRHGYCLIPYMTHPNSLNFLIKHLLKITIAWGIGEAASVFDRFCSHNGVLTTFQHVEVLRGISVNPGQTLQICKGMKLTQIDNPKYYDELDTYWSRYLFHNFEFRTSKIEPWDILLIIDMPVYHIPHNSLSNSEFPSKIFVKNLPLQDNSLPSLDNLPNIDGLRQEFELNVINVFRLKDVQYFIKSFTQLLSLVCNWPIHTSYTWDHFKEDELYSQLSYSRFTPFRNYFQNRNDPLEQSEIEETLRLYESLKQFGSEKNKLLIAIERWISSKTNEGVENKVIDLGIALETLYLPDSSSGELTFKLSLRASRFLGTNIKTRKSLMDKFRAIYTCRSKVVHTGEMPRVIKKPLIHHKDMENFILEIQDLCRCTILKILDEEKFPDWDNLLLN